jgi:methylated-DNA-protein-cysteine methyltransferase-like protein
MIQQIPAGSVMTYGQIARLAGSPRGARQVVRILHSMSQKHQLPWHRVINSKGEIALTNPQSFQRQKQALEQEGVIFLAPNRVDLQANLYEPINGGEFL